jgi:predicted CxxxxCH...CXXCH cytochrome family protein
MPSTGAQRWQERACHPPEQWAWPRRPPRTGLVAEHRGPHYFFAAARRTGRPRRQISACSRCLPGARFQVFTSDGDHFTPLPLTTAIPGQRLGLWEVCHTDDRTQITLFSAAPTASRQTKTGAHSGGYSCGSSVLSGAVSQDRGHLPQSTRPVVTCRALACHLPGRERAASLAPARPWAERTGRQVKARVSGQAAGEATTQAPPAVSDVRPAGRVDGAVGTFGGVEGCRVAGAAAGGSGAAAAEPQAEAGLGGPGGDCRVGPVLAGTAADGPSGDAGYAAALAPAAGPLALDLSPYGRQAADRWQGRSADRADGAGEPGLGLPADPG